MIHANSCQFFLQNCVGMTDYHYHHNRGWQNMIRANSYPHENHKINEKNSLISQTLQV